MQQQLSVITLGVSDLTRSRKFYGEGFGWKPVFENAEIAQPLIDRLASAGGKVLRAGDAPEHGGFRGYVADPDDHAWEIAWNPAWKVDDRGLVTFGL